MNRKMVDRRGRSKKIEKLGCLLIGFRKKLENALGLPRSFFGLVADKILIFWN